VAEPRARGVPIIDYGADRHAERLGCLFDAKTAEEAQLNHLAGPGVHRRESRQRIFEREDVHEWFWRRDVQALERRGVHAAATFAGASRTRGVHQDPPHHFRCGREEVGAILPADDAPVEEPDVGLLHEVCRLPPIGLALARQHPPGHAAKFEAHERGELFQSLGVPTAPGLQQAGQVRDPLGHSHSLPGPESGRLHFVPSDSACIGDRTCERSAQGVSTPFGSERSEPMPAIGFRIARASAFAFLLVFTSLTTAGIDGLQVTQVAAASNQNIAAPDQPGPFNVGVTVFSATMSGGRTTRVQVFYPTAEPADCAMRYRIAYLAGFFDLQSPLCARPNALAVPGSFPLVVHDHGGPGPGADFQRVAQLPLHEIMASHGFVTAVALHSADPVVRVRDLALLIDALLARNAASGDALAGSIDPDRIGISGVSAGAAAAIGAAGGVEDHGVPADTRIKAMVVYEPGLEYPFDAAKVAIPYLIMGGSQSRYGLAIPALFAETVLALPRIYVLNPSATHLSYQTGMCAEIDQTREAALSADPALLEPLTTRITTNPAAARAYDLWNMGQILFPLFGPGGGSGRNFCTRVGVDSIRSLDANPQDGFTDSPPFLPTDAFTLNPVIPEEILVPQITLHTVAFWKTFLQGDHHYMRYLTPGYAQSHHLQAAVFKIE